MGDFCPLLDGALAEHIRLADEMPLVIQDLQGGQEEEGIVCVESGFVGAGVDDAVLGAELVVEPVEFALLGLNHFIGVVLRLVLNELPNRITDGDETFHAVLCCHGQLNGIHPTVFPVVDLSFDQRIGEVSHIRVSGNGLVLFLLGQLVEVILRDAAGDVLNRLGEHFIKVLPVIGNAGGLRAEGTADLPHFTHHHIRVVHKVLVHGQTVFIGVQVYPARFLRCEGVPLLEKENI